MNGGAEEQEEQNDAHVEARDAALNLLSYRARSVAEMRRRLRRKGHEEAAVEAVIAWLLDHGYLDDRDFARQFLLERLRRKPRGPFALVQELRKRGIGRALAETMVEAVMEEEDLDEDAVARAAAERWLRRQSEETVNLLGRSDSTDDGEAARRRLYAHLERRGFRRHTARRTLEGVVRELQRRGGDSSREPRV